MMRLRKFGFYDEMPVEVARASLVNASSDAPRAYEPEVLEYLEGGEQLLAIPGVVSDLVDDSQGIIGPPHVFTDGAWAWSADVVYYIKKYHVAVPPDFLRNMQNNDWQCPEVPDPDSLELEGWIES